jgi:hypothetical protein
MGKKEEKQKKKAAARAKNLARTAKGIEKFVCSFYLKNVEIQAQRPYKTTEDIEADRTALAELKKVERHEIISKIIDNRNQAERKKEGGKISGKEKKARKAVKEAEQTAANLPAAYKPITPERAILKFVEIMKDIKAEKDKEALMAEEHKEEKAAQAAILEGLQKSLRELSDSISPKQLDLFRHAAKEAPKKDSSQPGKPKSSPKSKKPGSGNLAPAAQGKPKEGQTPPITGNQPPKDPAAAPAAQESSPKAE